jgi:hypothetical protein
MNVFKLNSSVLPCNKGSPFGMFATFAFCCKISSSESDSDDVCKSESWSSSVSNSDSIVQVGQLIMNN